MKLGLKLCFSSLTLMLASQQAEPVVAEAGQAKPESSSAEAVKGEGSLTLIDAIQTSLKNNLSVQIAKETKEGSRGQLLMSEGPFDWLLDSRYSRTWSKGAAEEPTRGGSKRQSSAFDVELSKPFVWGGDLKLSYNTSSFTGDGEHYGSGKTFYRGTFGATYTQQLLRGFGREANATQLLVSRKNHLMADQTFEMEMINLVAHTENLYWDLVSAQRGRENKRKALELANRQLKDTQIRIRVGTLARIEAATPEAAVAMAEKELLEAENAFLNAQDALLFAMYADRDGRPSTVQATDNPPLATASLEEATAEKTALENRVELRKGKLEIEQRELLEKEARNGKLPKLYAFAGYNGTSSDRSSIAYSNGDLASSKNTGYSVGLGFSMTLGNRAAKGKLIQAQSETRKSHLDYTSRALEIRLETRRALRNVLTSEKSMQSSEKVRIQREKDVEATLKKYSKGMTTNFEVMAKQRELDEGRKFELEAQIKHAKDLVELDKAMGRLLQARNITLN